MKQIKGVFLLVKAVIVPLQQTLTYDLFPEHRDHLHVHHRFKFKFALLKVLNHFTPATVEVGVYKISDVLFIQGRVMEF